MPFNHGPVQPPIDDTGCPTPRDVLPQEYAGRHTICRLGGGIDDRARNCMSSTSFEHALRLEWILPSMPAFAMVGNSI